MQTEIQIDASGAYYEVGLGTESSGGSGSGSSTQKLQTAEISLTDCLACRCDVSRQSPFLSLPSPVKISKIRLQRLHHLRRVRPHHPPITHRGPFRPRREPQSWVARTSNHRALYRPTISRFARRRTRPCYFRRADPTRTHVETGAGICDAYPRFFPCIRHYFCTGDGTARACA
jgi:hypothetical protein